MKFHIDKLEDVSIRITEVRSEVSQALFTAQMHLKAAQIGAGATIEVPGMGDMAFRQWEETSNKRWCILIRCDGRSDWYPIGDCSASVKAKCVSHLQRLIDAVCDAGDVVFVPSPIVELIELEYRRHHRHPRRSPMR